MKVKPAIMVLADISGYTEFVRLNSISILHAETIVTELLESVTLQATFPLRLNKLEGDAAFFYCELEEEEIQAAVNDVARQIRLMMSAFSTTHAALLEKSVGGCICDACCHIDRLTLKVFAHVGQTVIKTIDSRTELGGEPPIVIHRLAKNSVSSGEYVLVSDGFAGYLSEDIYQNAAKWEETYDDIGRIACRIFFPCYAKPVISTPPRLSRLVGVLEAGRLFWRSARSFAVGTPRQFLNIPR